MPLSVIALNTAFSSGTAGGTQSTAGQSVGKLCLPEGVISLGAGAFGMCLNLTNVVNFIPDSVTSVGSAIFYKSGVRQDLYLRGISSIGRCAFTGTGIKSVEFGPNLKLVGNGSNKQGAFQNCSSLTNIVFDSHGNNIVLQNASFGISATLTQPLILYGVTNIDTEAFSVNTKFKSVTFDDGIINIAGDFPPANNTLLTEVHFLGRPPTGVSMSAVYNTRATTITTYVKRKHAEAWKTYAKDEVLNMDSSLFKADYCGTINPSYRPLLIEDKLVGTTVVVR